MSNLTTQLLSGRRLGGPAAARMTIDGKEFINFFGAGYLALTNVPEVRTAVSEALASGVSFADHVPAGLGGVDPLFARVERLAAAALGTEACVYFASGYLIGAVGITAYEKKFDLIVMDELAHYNLRDAAKQSGLPTYTFAHSDPGSLAETLKRHVGSGQRPLIMTDGVFTTGHIPPLGRICGHHQELRWPPLCR